VHRRDFGTWGIELSDGEFAQALAALGVLAWKWHEWSGKTPDLAQLAAELGRLTQADMAVVPWAVAMTPDSLPVFSYLPDARTLAITWKEGLGRRRFRLEIDRISPLNAGFDPPSTLPWISAQLSRPEVGAQSVYVRADEPRLDAGWGWPLRVGVLRDPDSTNLGQQLSDFLQRAEWARPLAKVVDGQVADAESDILLLPGDVRSALASVASLPRPTRADCTVVLGRARGADDQWYRLVEGIRAAVRTSGVVVADISTKDPRHWFHDLLRELSHNHPIDVALFNAARNNSAPPPFIAASRQLVDFSRLSRQLDRIGVSMQSPEMRDMRVEVRKGTSLERELGRSGPVRLDELGGHLREISSRADKDEAFLHETGAATTGAEAASAPPAASEPAIPAAVTRGGTTRGAEPAADPRYIQAQVHDMSQPGQPVRRQRSLRAGAPHEIAVRIGVPEDDWLGGEPNAPAFPADRLPPDEEEHTLAVALSAPGLLDKSEVATITLPRHGNSKVARFYLLARQGVAALDGRIVIAHRNRVLQTARIRAAIVDGAFDDAPGRIEVEPEVIARQRLGDLKGRAQFDAAVVLNHTASGVSAMMSMSDDKVARFDVPDTLTDEIRYIDKLLTAIVNEPKKYMGDLRSKETEDLLRQLARHGSIINDHIVSDAGLGKKGLAGDGPIQIISAVADARLPAEFIYARESPDEGAPLCPNAEESLRSGKCDATCLSGAREHEVICPLAFWGVRRVIERYRHDSDLTEFTRGRDFAVIPEPSVRRSTLEVLRGGLVAGTQKVDKTVPDGLQAICDAITEGTATPLLPVPDWAAWVVQIDATAPSLLVLIVHTEPTPEDAKIPRMEIGTESWLESAGIREGHVRKSGAGEPLVLLLGCETGNSDRDFANFIGRLRNRGAAIVVASGAKLHTLHAVPAAKAFVVALRNALARGDASFGEVMRDVRRELLANGMPMVLALTAYGDADWRLVPHH